MGAGEILARVRPEERNRMICPMTTADCPSCDDSTGCKLLTCKARCVWPDCLCADPGDPRPLFCRAEPWAMHSLPRGENDK